MTEDDILFLDTVDIELPPLSSTGYVLDIGGGGEGVIGRIEGLQVVAIDCREDELAEATEGPLKVVMDARNLHFLDCTFFAATAFFSLMYFDDETGLQAALAEVFRVLKPGGLFHIWDVDTSTLPESTKTLFAVRIKFIVNGIASETAYGRPWPQKRRDHKYYIGLAETAGFVHTDTESRGHTFCSTFRKTRSIELPKPDARDGL